MTGQPSRRDVLKAGVGLAVPCIVGASALGAPGRTPPSDRVAMGFIGVGGQGGGHLTGGAWTYLTGGYLGRDDVHILSVCDVRRSRRYGFKKRIDAHYVAKGFKTRACDVPNDFRRVLDRPDIDAVLIGTPIHWHATMTLMAAEAGKDVYCEKPTAVTIRESQAARAAVLRYGRVFQAGTQQRSEYGGKFRRACEYVRSGRIGKLESVYANRAGGGIAWRAGFGEGRPVPAELDWDLYLGPAPWMPYTGHANAHMFGTGNINWAQHHYDIVQWALDADRTGPVQVGFEEGKLAWRFASGVVVYGAPYPGERVGGSGGATFVGTKGRIAVDRENIVSHPASILEKPLGAGDAHLSDSTSHSGNFLECVRTRARTLCDVETAHRAISIVLLGDITMRLRRNLKWDPEKEKFIGDDEANRLCSIAKRPPWRI